MERANDTQRLSSLASINKEMYGIVKAESDKRPKLYPDDARLLYRNVRLDPSKDTIRCSRWPGLHDMRPEIAAQVRYVARSLSDWDHDSLPQLLVSISVPLNMESSFLTWRNYTF
jgi:hypothetical protein